MQMQYIKEMWTPRPSKAMELSSDSNKDKPQPTGKEIQLDISVPTKNLLILSQRRPN